MNPSEKQPTIEQFLDEHPLDPKDLHKKATRLTRKNLLLSASECFAKKGYHQTTIREIASKAGVTLGALYHHFKDKKELLMTVNRRRQVVALATMRGMLAQEEDFFKALKKALRELFGLLADDPILRGVTREYMGMAMIDPEVKRMHIKNDIEFRDMYSKELQRRYPDLSFDRRFMLNHMVLVAFEGLMTALVVDSPMAGKPELILDSFVDTFQNTVEKWIHDERRADGAV